MTVEVETKTSPFEEVLQNEIDWSRDIKNQHHISPEFDCLSFIKGLEQAKTLYIKYKETILDSE